MIDTQYTMYQKYFDKSSTTYQNFIVLWIIDTSSVIIIYFCYPFFLGYACFHCSRDQRFQSWKIWDSLSNTPKEIPQIRESGKASGELSQRSHQGELFNGGKRTILCARLRHKTILCEHQPERFFLLWWDVLHNQNTYIDFVRGKKTFCYYKIPILISLEKKIRKKNLISNSKI